MKRGTPDHPKTLALMQALDVSRPMAVGLLELLWHFTARYAPRGDVGRWSDEYIAEAVCWSGEAGALVRGLMKSGWLDPDSRHRYLVHDWSEHADEATKKALARKGLRFAGKSRRCRDRVETLSRLPEPEPEPEPEPGQSQAEPVTDRQAGDARDEDPPASAEGEPSSAVTVLGPLVGHMHSPNPLVDRERLIRRGHELVQLIAPAEDLDPTEVLRKASTWRGKSYVRLDVMQDDRLAHTVADLEAWWRKLNGEPEPMPPAMPARASPDRHLKAVTESSRLFLETVGGGKGGVGRDDV